MVDAGGAGLVELLRGVLHGLTGEPLPAPPEVTAEITEESIHHEESEFRFCTVFLVEGDELDLDALLDRFAGDGLSYVQLIRGEGAPEEDELRERLAARGIEADVSWGGQPHYPLLLSAE